MGFLEAGKKFLLGALHMAPAEQSVGELVDEALGRGEPAAITVEATEQAPISDNYVCADDGRGIGVFDADNRGLEDMSASVDFVGATQLPNAPHDAKGHCVISFNNESGAGEASYKIHLVEPLQLFDKPMEDSAGLSGARPEALSAGPL